MLQDFSFAFRQLIKTPGFTAHRGSHARGRHRRQLRRLSLSSTASSCVRLSPVRPAEVVNVFTARQGAPHDYRPFSYNEFSTLRENNDVFTDVARNGVSALAGIGRDGGMRRSFVFLTSYNFFSLMGVKPVVRPLLRRRRMPSRTPTSRSWWRAIHIGRNSAAEPI